MLQQLPASPRRIALSLIGYWTLKARASSQQQHPVGCAHRQAPIASVTGQAWVHQQSSARTAFQQLGFARCQLPSLTYATVSR